MQQHCSNPSLATFFFRPISTTSSPATRLGQWKFLLSLRNAAWLNAKSMYSFYIPWIFVSQFTADRSHWLGKHQFFGWLHPSTLRPHMEWTKRASSMIFSRFLFVFNIESIIILFVFTRNCFLKIVHFFGFISLKMANMDKSCICSSTSLAFTPDSYLKWKPAMF